MKFFLFAGEPSGDLHGGSLLQRLQERLPAAQFVGVGGPKMRAAGLETVLQMEDFAVMGFGDVLLNLPKIIRQFRLVSRSIMELQPEAVILIDYPDFNLRLAKDLRKRGYQGKIIQYISPTVWAWRRGRVALMAQNYDLLLTIYPFEAQYYEGSGLVVEYVGNPLCEYIADYSYDELWKQRLEIPQDKPIIALFPGSRQGEIERNLPLQLQAVKLLQNQSGNCQAVAISCKNPQHAHAILQLAKQCQWPADQKLHFVPSELTYELMRDSHTAIAKSGTVTLELALHKRPTVVLYKMSAFNYFVAKYLMRINLPHYCMVNILLQKEVFPEFIAKNVSAQSLAEKLKLFGGQQEARRSCLSDCIKLRELLQAGGASQAAAAAILKSLTV